MAVLTSIVLLVVLTISAGLAHLPPVRQFVLDSGREQLLDSQVDFRGEGLEYNLLTLTASIRNVEIRSKQRPDLAPLFSADRVSVDVRWRGLASGSLIVEKATVEGARIQVEFDDQGSNVPETSTEASGAGPQENLPIIIESLEVFGPQIRYADSTTPAELGFADWRLRVEGNPENGEHRISFNVDGEGGASLAGDELPLSEVEAVLLLAANRVGIERAAMALGDLAIEADGEIRELADAVYDIALRVSGPVEEIAAWAGHEAPVLGDLKVDSRVRGRFDELEVSATVAGESFSYGQFRNANFTSELAWNGATNHIEVASFDVRGGFGRVSGSAALGADSEVDVRLRGFDLAAASRQLGAPAVVASRATGSVRAAWPGSEYEQARGGGSLSLSPAQTDRASEAALGGELRLTLSPNRFSVELEPLTGFATEVSGQVVIESLDRLGGELRVSAPSMADAAKVAATFLGTPPEESLLPTHVDGPIEVMVALSGTLDAPRAELVVEAPSTELGSLDGIAISSRLAVEPDSIELGQLQAKWRDQEFELGGTADSSSGETQLDLVGSLDGSLETLAQALELEYPVSGALNADFDVRGPPDHPQVELRMAGSEVRAYSELFGALSLEARADGSALYLQRLELVDGREKIVASGSLDLESGRLGLELGATDVVLTDFEFDGQAVRGELELKASASGLVSDPTAELQLTTAGLEVGGMRLDAIGLVSSLEHGLASLSLRAPRFGLRADAEAGLGAPHAAEFSLELDHADLALLTDTVAGRPPADAGGSEAPLRGHVSGLVTGEGELDDWRAMTIRADLSDLSLETAGQTVRNEGPLRAALAGRTVGFESFTLVSGASTFNLAGSMPLENGEGQIEAKGAFDLGILPAFLPEDLGLRASGALDIDATISGALDSFRPDVSLTLDGGEIELPHGDLSALGLDVRIDARAVDVRKFEAQWNGAAIDASAQVPLAILAAEGLPFDVVESDTPATWKASLSGLSLEALEATPEGIGGILDLEIEGAAAEATLEALHSTVRFPRLEVNLGELTLTQVGTSSLSIDGPTLTVSEFELMGPESEIVLTGSAGFDEPGELDLYFAADADAAILAYFTEAARFSGPFQLQGSVGGTSSDPKVSGRFHLADGQAVVDSPRLDIEGLELDLAFEGDRAEIETLMGSVNGGILAGSGRAALRGGEIHDIDLEFGAWDVFLDFPPGLRTLSQVEMSFAENEDNFLLLGGEVRIQDGSFRERLDIQSQVLTFLQSAGLDFAEEPDPLLSRIRYDVDIRTENPIAVDNNLAKLEAEFDLNLVGDYYRPSLLGRIEFAEGGEVYLAENEYVIDTGIVSFTSERTIRPALALTARTHVGGHEITMQANGDQEDLDTRFTSDTGLPEPDIISLLLTGRTLVDARESGVNIAREQALSFLTGQLGGRISEAAEQSLGLSRVRIEPNLISSESTPTARLTIGQQLSRRLNLIYSMNLRDSGDQIFVTEYDVTRRFNARGVKQSDNTYRFDFRHDVRFGLGMEPRQRRRRESMDTIGKVTLSGEFGMSEDEVAEVLNLNEGDDYDFFKVRNRIDRLEKRYFETDRLQSRVRLRREKEGTAVDLMIDIDAGPVVELVFEPAELGGSVRQAARQAWRRGVFDAQRIDDAEQAILEHLYRENRFEAKISTEISHPGEGRLRVNFEVDSGRRFGNEQLVFEGAGPIPAGELRLVLEQAEIGADLRLRSREAAETLELYYRQLGRLAVEVSEPEYELESDTGTARAVFRIQEGPVFRVGRLAFLGATVYTEDELRAAVTPEIGAAYQPTYLEKALQAIEELYWQRGYNDVLVNFVLTRNVEESRVDIEFQIEEQDRDVIREIAVEGAQHVDENYIRGRLVSSEGETLLTEENDRSRRRLYDTGAFALVDLETERIEGDEGGARGEKPLLLRATVREVSPFKVRYGALFDTDRGPGFISDFENRNTLGAARVVGLRARADQDFREVRGYFSQPLFRGLPLTTTASVFRNREKEGFIFTNKTGVSIQQEMEIGRHFIWQYGYRFERARISDQDPDAFITLDNVEFSLAPLTTSLSWDSRDDILDSSRGFFSSHAFEYAPQALGGDVTFVRYFGQFFAYRPLIRSRMRPFEKVRRRPKLLYAGGVRLGLARGAWRSERGAE